VSPEVIQLDRQKSIPESQIFDENGKDISQSVEINSSESFKQAT
jgi:hypothetical protein